MPLLPQVLLYGMTAVNGIIALIVLYLLLTGLFQEERRERREREGVSVKDEDEEDGMDVDPEELHQVIHDADDAEADAGNDDGFDDGGGVDMLEHVVIEMLDDDQ